MLIKCYPPLSRHTAQGISLLLKDVNHTITFLPWPITVHLEGSGCGDLATSPLTITLGVTLLAGGDLLWTTGDGVGSAGKSCKYAAFQIESTRISIPALSLKCTCKNQQIKIHLQIAHNIQYVFSRTELAISTTKKYTDKTFPFSMSLTPSLLHRSRSFTGKYSAIGVYFTPKENNKINY